MSKSSDRQAHRRVERHGRVGAVGEDHVRRDDVHPRRDRPGVEVVAVDDARRLEDVLADMGHVDVLGRRLEEDVGRVAEQREGARQDQQGDRDGRDGIGRDPAGEGDDERPPR